MIDIMNYILANPKISIIAISVLVTLIIVIFTKYFTNQNRMKELKEIQKACQIKMKDVNGKPEEMAKIQKEVMECTMELSKYSLKPMLFLFIPLILIFAWANGNLAFYPLMPEEQFSITAITDDNIIGNIKIEVPEKVSIIGDSEKELIAGGGFFGKNKQANFDLKIEERGIYLISFTYNDEKVTKEVLIADIGYAKPSEKYKDGTIEEVKINYNQKTGPCGWSWLWYYILTSLFSSIILRKVLNVV